MQLLKQSTAATVKLGPFVDDADGKTPEEGLAIAQADIRLTKNGGAFAQTNNAAGATHDENGWYGVPLGTTDTATLGRLKVAIYESGALIVWEEYMVVPEDVYDSLVTGDSYLPVNLRHILDYSLSETGAGDVGEAFEKLFDVATPLLMADEVMRGTDSAALAATALSTATWTAAAAAALLDWVDTGRLDAILDIINTNAARLTAARAAVLTDWINDGRLDAILDLILADTNELQTDWTNDGRLDLLLDAAVVGAAPGLTTDVAVSDTTSSFTLTAGIANADAHDRTIISVQDADDAHWETRYITDWTAGRVVEVDEPFSFTPAIADVVIVHRAYVPQCSTTGSSGVVDTFTVTILGVPLANCDVWVTTDQAGTDVRWSNTTDAIGVATFTIPIAAGYWVWANHAGYDFAGFTPREFDVSAGGIAWA